MHFSNVTNQPRVTVTLWFVYKVIWHLESIYHLCINPIHRIGLIHKWSIDLPWLNWSVHVRLLINNCKQSISSLSLLVGMACASNCMFQITDITQGLNFRSTDWNPVLWIPLSYFVRLCSYLAQRLIMVCIHQGRLILPLWHWSQRPRSNIL